MDVSAKMSSYLLSGWTMIDELCPKPNCPGVPLMRKGTTQFCVSCDPLPSTAFNPPPSILPPSPPLPQEKTSPHSSPSTLPSTPPTSHSRADSPPPLPAVDPAIALARRQQSDLASQRIGELLLKGWTLLGEECTNRGCWGVPLMGKPRREGTGKLCVICRTEYGSNNPAITPATGAAFTDGVNVGVGAPPKEVKALNDREIEMMLGLDIDVEEHDEDVESLETGKGKQKARTRKFDLSRRSNATSSMEPPRPVSFSSKSKGISPPSPLPQPPSPTSSSPYTSTALSLETSLSVLNTHLDNLTKRQSKTVGLDVKAIGDAAESIEKVCKALEGLRRLER